MAALRNRLGVRGLLHRWRSGRTSISDRPPNARPSAIASPPIGRLAPLVGLPPAHFDELYRRPVLWLAANRRASGDHHQALEESLAIAERVLLVRQAYLLPANTAPEDAVRRADCWTYGVFLAALFHRASVDAAMEGRGEAWAEEVLSTLSRSGRDWISGDPDLLAALRAVLLDDQKGAGVVAEILARAKASASSEAASNCQPEKRQGAHAAFLADVPAFLASLIDDGQLPINKDDGLAWITTKNLWLKMEGGFDLIRDWLISESRQLLPSNNNLMNELLRQGIFLPVPNSGKAIWRMAVSGAGKPKVQSLLRLPLDTIWPDPKDRPTAYWGKIKRPPARPEPRGSATTSETASAN